MSQSEIVVEGRNLTIGYQVGKKRTEVHSGLNFQLFRGGLPCLLGANGAGKSASHFGGCSTVFIWRLETVGA